MMVPAVPSYPLYHWWINPQSRSTTNNSSYRLCDKHLCGECVLLATRDSSAWRRWSGCHDVWTRVTRDTVHHLASQHCASPGITTRCSAAMQAAEIRAIRRWAVPAPGRIPGYWLQTRPVVFRSKMLINAQKKYHYCHADGPLRRFKDVLKVLKH